MSNKGNKWKKKPQSELTLSPLAKIKQRQENESLKGLAKLRQEKFGTASSKTIKLSPNYSHSLANYRQKTTTFLPLASTVSVGDSVAFLIDADALSGYPGVDPKEKIEGKITGIKKGLGVYITSRHGDHYRKFVEL